MKKMIVSFSIFLAAIIADAVDAPSLASVNLKEWRVRPATKREFAKKRKERGHKWFWCGTLANAYKIKEVFDHKDGFIYYIHFHVGALAKNATPILIVNNLYPGTEIYFNSRKLNITNEKKGIQQRLETINWYAIPKEIIRQDASSSKDNNGIIVWMPKINKTEITGKSLAMIVFENPDVIKKREELRKSRSLYLRDANFADDPYVARHW